MPFKIDLLTKQTTKMWTFKKTDAALELQDLLDKGNRKGYIQRLTELTGDETNPHQFIRTRGEVYEMFDEGETATVPIKFEVKGPVITWFFIAPTDRTHQSFRDLVFNTAAKAHTHVKNACETYYRGTDSLHFKEMHLYPGEALFNHNHYRTADNSPITPVEVYEHLLAFCAQMEGKIFIPTAEERDGIILKFAIFWADYDLDIKYVAFSGIKGEGGLEKMLLQLKDIAIAGKLTPDQADRQLDEFFASEYGKSMFKLAEGFGFPENDKKKEDIKNFLKKNYRILYAQFAPKLEQEILLDKELESPKTFLSFSSGSRRSSPREEYCKSPDQILDEIDLMEYETFAADLTKHCRSINKQLLQDLEFEDFRKGILLYHALRTAQKVKKLTPEKGLRFHPDLITHELIEKMVEELPSLQLGSTEDNIGPTLLNRLLEWVQKAPPALDEWIKRVKVNGSRALGAELSQVRQENGAVDLRHAIPQGDRGKDSNIAEIDLDNVDLQKIFLPDVKTPSTGELEEIRQLKEHLSKEMKKIIQNQSSKNPFSKEVFQSKMAVIDTAFAVLSGKANLSALKCTIEKNKGWNSVSLQSSIKSSLEKSIEDVFSLGAKLTQENKNTHQVQRTLAFY
ncbi:Uncharacterised protein [Legionella lansingensis]|uniref:Uncharacterized protein n=1 Tax=Legionella lansingensis TaxID=45067 RepID=A0A0W0VPJ5_9GAMM|nr:hypothetical protein [Legionella lansingensis]KTD22098.1 hypothetical protein Llan_1361 [Legionella lansingensis]SNV45815.1 Uncharacterised protein [Legionella lansingensis]